MTPLSDLIARLEAAQGGSEELSREISEAIGWRQESVGDESRGYFVPRYVVWFDPSGARKEAGQLYPPFSQSLDAALTLVPERWNYQLLKTGGVLLSSGKPFSASIKAPSEYGWVDPPYPSDGYADTMPLALCIAALKAREAAR